jgi:uncharacterized protein (DUF2141 family)
MSNKRIFWVLLTPIVTVTAAARLQHAHAGPDKDAGAVTVTVDGFRNDSGHARIALFNRDDGFPDSDTAPLKKTTVAIVKGRVQVKFEGLPAGDYAVSMYHDENDDAKFNKGMFGIPKEGYGVSNNVIHRLRAPNFDEARFRIGDPNTAVQIHVHY